MPQIYGWFTRETMAASLAVRISFERSALSVSRVDLCSSVDKRGTILTATYSMKKVRLANRTALNCVSPLKETIGGVEGGAKKEKEREIMTCSPVSIFFASFTLPMLPAPIVLPRAQFPVGVVIVVRRLGWEAPLGCP